MRMASYSRLMKIVLAVTAATAMASFAVRASGATLRDARGKVVAVWPTPKRIVSATLLSDEILLDLVPAGELKSRIVALSPLAFQPRFSNVADRAALVGKRFGEEVESLLALRPDLVILATYNRPELVAALDRARIRTFVMPDVKSLDDIPASIQILGRLVGREPDAELLVNAFTAERRAIRDRMRVGVPWASINPPTVMNFDVDSVVYGKGTMFDALVREAGGENIPAAKGVSGWSKVSDEVLAGMRPDWIIMLDDGSGAVRQMARMRDSAVWKQIPAVREGRVIFVPEREMSSVSHHSLKAVERLGKAFMTLREGGGRR